MILSILVIIILGISFLLIVAILFNSHKIRYIDGYDRDLETDYQALMEQVRK